MDQPASVFWTGGGAARRGLIDPTVNPNLLVALPGGLLRPIPLFNTSPLLAQGFNLGVRYSY